MGRFKAIKTIELLIISSMVVLLLLPACRRESEPLDRNKEPKTYLTSSPPETTETDYRVHLYWYGTDDDGIVVKYIWYISDTVATLNPEHETETEFLDWRPADRGADYNKGRFTSRTDSVFIFQGFNVVKNTKVNRQAFHICAIDDGGKLDHSPARLQFIARVKGVPEVQFWFQTEEGKPFREFNPDSLDTISMYTPFKIRFFATTINNYINGYQYIYAGKVYPDCDNDNVPDWFPCPEDYATEKEKYAILRQPVTIELANTGDKAFPNGDFYFKVIARDEAGALSSSNILTGEGVCQIVINHDPDTRIRGGLAHYVMQDGTPVEREIDFRDGEPDTLPYNSTMLIEYFAWDDPKDIPTLQYQNPPLPLRFQFRYKRWAEGGRAMKLSPWYPLGGAEDTNPFADLDDERRDIDSTSIRVGTFDYEFFARSFDEQYRSDGTPDVISFVGNYPPSVDSIRIGFWEPDTLKNYGVKFFQEIPNDTLYIGWRGLVNEIKLNRGDTCYIDTVKIDMVRRKITKYYKFVLRGFGHDDYRDPPGSGVKGWQFFIDSDGGNYNFKKEGDWLFEYAKNFMEHELFIKITVPFEQALTDSVVNDPPAYFGDQQLSVTGIDIKDVEIFKEGIRGISPEFEGDSLTSPGDWVLLDYRLSNYARSDTLRSMFYIKMVY